MLYHVYVLSVILLTVALLCPIPTTGSGDSGFGVDNIKPTQELRSPDKDGDIQATLNHIETGVIGKFFGKENLPTTTPKLWIRSKKSLGDDFSIELRSKDPTQFLRIELDPTSGDWTVKSVALDNPFYTDPDSTWMPIEGIFGVYPVSSGIVWVFVAKSEPVYSAPRLPNGDKKWWKIQQVTNLKVVHLRKYTDGLSAQQDKEEARQLRLLRKTLKQHALYFSSSLGEDSITHDFTRNFQRSQEMWNTRKRSETSPKSLYWYQESIENRPDPRFFWNQVAVQPLLQRQEGLDPSSEEYRANDTLLRAVIPLTSAFVGIQRGVTATLREGKSFSYDQLLISRRSRFRTGTRFTRRGADSTGAVANFAETEQMCFLLSNSGKNNKKKKKSTVDQIFSHVQTRGSIPLRWSSPTDVKTYRPKVNIGTDPLAQARAMRLHLMEQLKLYTINESISEKENARDGKIPALMFLNLVDKKSDQGRLGRAFDAVLWAVLEVCGNSNLKPHLADESDDLVMNNSEALSANMLSPDNVAHFWFDFHAEVKDGKWDRLTFLLKDLKPTLDYHGYFSASPPSTKDGSWTIHTSQRGIVRTNCMDCLDRTNVVQSIVGRYLLHRQLNATLQEDDSWQDLFMEYEKNPLSLSWATGETSHRLLWADNADMISRLYAGTSALKRDFTRHGKRTKTGPLEDGMNSLQRYYLNNFLDADRQEGMDLMVGHVSFSTTSPTDESSGWLKPTSFRSALLGVAGTSFAQESESDVELDLRWLPGDLHSQVLSQASTGSELNRTETSSSSEDQTSFRPSKALEAMDKRSASYLPWWAEFADRRDHP